MTQKKIVFLVVREESRPEMSQYQSDGELFVFQGIIFTSFQSLLLPKCHSVSCEDTILGT